jgi:hypothetical protein
MAPQRSGRARIRVVPRPTMRVTKQIPVPTILLELLKN